MSAKSREVSEVQLSAAAQHIATSDNYHIIHYSGEINLYNSATGAKIGQVDIGQKVNDLTTGIQKDRECSEHTVFRNIQGDPANVNL